MTPTAKTGSSDTPWRFAGAYFDRFPSVKADDQEGLYKIGERYYDPRTARWTQRDPLDQSTDLRQANKYTYAAGDPINLTDPTGTNIGDFFEDALRVYSAVEGLVGAGLIAYGTTVGLAGCAAATAGVGTVACAPLAISGYGSAGVLAYSSVDTLIDYADFDYRDGDE